MLYIKGWEWEAFIALAENGQAKLVGTTSHEFTHPGKMASAAAEEIRAEMVDLEAEDELAAPDEVS